MFYTTLASVEHQLCPARTPLIYLSPEPLTLRVGPLSGFLGQLGHMTEVSKPAETMNSPMAFFLNNWLKLPWLFRTVTVHFRVRSSLAARWVQHPFETEIQEKKRTPRCWRHGQRQIAGFSWRPQHPGRPMDASILKRCPIYTLTVENKISMRKLLPHPYNMAPAARAENKSYC